MKRGYAGMAAEFPIKCFQVNNIPLYIPLFLNNISILANIHFHRLLSQNAPPRMTHPFHFLLFEIPFHFFCAVHFCSRGVFIFDHLPPMSNPPHSSPVVSSNFPSPQSRLFSCPIFKLAYLHYLFPIFFYNICLISQFPLNCNFMRNNTYSIITSADLGLNLPRAKFLVTFIHSLTWTD